MELPPRAEVACFPQDDPWNPYLRLLYERVSAHGLARVYGARLSAHWLWSARRSVGAIHIHWPEGLYRCRRGRKPVRAALSWLKLAALGARLLVARALGYRIVWTAHQIRPHETACPTLDLAAALLLTRLAHSVLAHDVATASRVRSELRGTARKIAVVPHGSYVGVYPPGRARAAVRAELGIPPATFVFLCFGELRANRQVEHLLAAFARMSSDVGLVVAGYPKNRDVAARLQAAAAGDPRITPVMSFVPPEQVRELFEACDAAVHPRLDGGTSGSLLLALSLGLPVVAADLPVNRELVGDGRAGWLFAPGAPQALTRALEAASANGDEARRRGAEGHRIAAARSWREIGERTAALLRGDER